MNKRLNVTVDKDVFDALEKFSKLKSRGNRSAMVNALLKEGFRRLQEDSLAHAYQAMSKDTAYMEELAEWDTTLLDGLE